MMSTTSRTHPAAPFICSTMVGLLECIIIVLCVMFSWTPSRMASFSAEQRQLVQVLMAAANLAIVLCIVWFCISPVWFSFQILGLMHINLPFSDYWRRETRIIILMFVVQYVVGGWLFLCWIMNNPPVERFFKRKTDQRRNKTIECAAKEQSSAYEKMPHEKINVLVHV